jgi:hypothetical protein
METSNLSLNVAERNGGCRIVNAIESSILSPDLEIEI